MEVQWMFSRRCGSWQRGNHGKFAVPICRGNSFVTSRYSAWVVTMQPDKADGGAKPIAQRAGGATNPYRSIIRNPPGAAVPKFLEHNSGVAKPCVWCQISTSRFRQFHNLHRAHSTIACMDEASRS